MAEMMRASAKNKWNDETVLGSDSDDDFKQTPMV